MMIAALLTMLVVQLTVTVITARFLLLTFRKGNTGNTENEKR